MTQCTVQLCVFTMEHWRVADLVQGASASASASAIATSLQYGSPQPRRLMMSNRGSHQMQVQLT